ncbi:MAG: hypothetical protein GDA48_20965 [Hormoscilla sp. GM102CHS1]|nr:hypothetical protein [Hormoscilla sp. GM102CHS1]
MCDILKQQSTLVQVMEREADNIAEKGNQNTANSEAYFNFLTEVLQAVSKDPSPQSVYPLLQANLDKLDDNFHAVLRTWAEGRLSEIKPSQAEDIASDISNFSNLILEFPLGNQAANVEISLVGYEISLTVFTRDSHSENWAIIQNNLGAAYRNRIKGDKAENQENALPTGFVGLHSRSFPHLLGFYSE